MTMRFAKIQDDVFVCDDYDVKHLYYVVFAISGFPLDSFVWVSGKTNKFTLK